MADTKKSDRRHGSTVRILIQALFAACAMGLLCLFPLPVGSQQNGQAPSLEPVDPPALKEAVICESLKDGSPVNVGIVFSIRLGRVVCFSSFGALSQKTAVHHKWFHRSILTNNQRLWIYSPSWAAASSIQLREADKGPWQVEISDSSGKILRVLRFSIVD